MIEFLAVGGYVILLSAIGSILGSWLLQKPLTTGRPHTGERGNTDDEPLGWGWSYLIGAAVVGFFLYLPLAIVGHIQRSFFALAILGGLILGVVGLVRLFRTHPIAAIRRSSWLASLPPPLRYGVLTLLGLCAVSAAVVRPTDFDARAIYAFKARVLYDVGTIRGEDFQDAERMHFNAHYPLLIPLHEATIYWLQGSTSDHCIRLWFFGFVVALASIVARELRRFYSSATAAILTLLLICIPSVIRAKEGAGLTSSADLPLACFLTAGVLACMNWLRTQNERQAILAAIMLGAAAMTKSEGTLWVAAATFAMLALVVSRQLLLNRAALKTCWGGAVLMAVALALIVAVRRQIPYSIYLRSYSAAAMDWNWLSQLWLRPYQVALYGLKVELRASFWHCAWLSIAAALLLHRKTKVATDVLFARMLLATVSALFFAVFVITPYHLYWHMSTAMHRLMLQMLPLAWLVAAENLKAAGWIEHLQATWRSTSNDRQCDLRQLPNIARQPRSLKLLDVAPFKRAG